MGRISGRSSQTTSAHHMAMVNNSATTCARNESCVNEPTTCEYGTSRNNTAVSASGIRGSALRYEPPRDEKHEPGLERHRHGDNGIDRVQPVGPGPRPGERREHLTARRVVDHLAEVGLDLWLVDQAPVPLDVVDEEQMMGNVDTGAERKQGRPRQPQQPRQYRCDDDDQRHDLAARPNRLPATARPPSPQPRQPRAAESRAVTWRRRSVRAGTRGRSAPRAERERRRPRPPRRPGQAGTRSSRLGSRRHRHRPESGALLSTVFHDYGDDWAAEAPEPQDAKRENAGGIRPASNAATLMHPLSIRHRESWLVVDGPWLIAWTTLDHDRGGLPADQRCAQAAVWYGRCPAAEPA